MKKFLVALALAVGIAGCGGTATTDNTPATTLQADAAKVAHWRQVTKEMSCKELNRQEAVQVRLNTPDGIALTAIHSEQTKKDCPQ